jgi:hypothetical protein
MLVNFLCPPRCRWEWQEDAQWWILLVPTTWNYTMDTYNMEKVLFITAEFFRDVETTFAIIAIQEACRRALSIMEMFR